jgi:hypothetical protein
MELLDMIENYPVLVGVFQTLIIFIVGKKFIQDVSERNQFYDNKPYIAVIPRFEKNPLPDQSGFIRYIEVGNFGRGVATNVVIEFLYIKTWEVAELKESIVIDGEYKFPYLPPSPMEKYSRPNEIYSIPPEWYPQSVRVSYDFRGDREVEEFELVPAKLEDRGHGVEIYDSHKDANLRIRNVAKKNSGA